MYYQEMYWIIEYICENNLEKKSWESVIEEAQNEHIRELTRQNKKYL